ncbi:phosphatase PAP2 family protein [Agarivorans gilvus]|uniref:Phosphatidic acid phosphatase type 2/haloperoxidase domain-containing protein n=1 Tax=Agarivorans gilvus TaxID=680279 RepID=A0ABQ1HVE8_9ALTE|nr:phosphatase PAP2 family protein [Agarivorans gilvus]GGA93364.1 hypothetical protein GCM10007414_02550 [Agarivorans gilvus]
MRLSHKLAIGPLLVSLCALSHADTWVEIGDYTQVILPLGGLGLSLAKGDTTGTLQLTKSFATSFTITQSIKWVVDKRRPNFTTNNSFPSGHTTAAFSGASFLHTRYGSAWGIPAYTLAAYTGWSRVHGDKHYWDDVLAGASIATLSNLFFVNPITEDISLSPLVDGDAKGIQLSLSNSFFEGGSRSKRPADHFKPKFKFDFMLGPTRLKSNDIGNLAQQSILFEQDDTLTTAAARWSWQANDKHRFSYYTQPYEARAQGLAVDNSDIYAQYQVWDNKLNWQYKLLAGERWSSELGLGLLIQYAQAALYADASFEHDLAKEEEWLVYPLANANIAFQVSPPLKLELAGEYGNNSEGEVAMADLSLNYAFNRRWDIAVGYNYYQRDQDNAKTFRKIEFDSLYLRFGYAF